MGWIMSRVEKGRVLSKERKKDLICVGPISSSRTREKKLRDETRHTTKATAGAFRFNEQLRRAYLIEAIPKIERSARG